MTTVVVEALGVPVAIVVAPSPAAPTPDPQTPDHQDAVAIWADEVRRAWSRCLLDPDAPTDDRVPLAVPPRADSLALQGAMRVLTTQVTMAALRAHAGRCVLLHAGAVTHPESGATAVCVAASGTGKTTLVRRLARDWGYLTDESVAVEDDLTLLAYPKPLSLVVEQGPKREVSPDELGLIRAHAHPVLTHLCVLERDPTADAARSTRLSLVDGLLALAPQTSGLAQDPRGLERLATLVARVGVVRHRYAESDDLVETITRATLEEAPAAAASFVLDPPVDPATPAAGQLVRSPTLTLLHSDDQHVVFDGAAISEVSPLVAAILTEAAAPVARERVREVVLERFGPPEDGEVDSALDAVLEELGTRGWLVRR